MKKYRVAMTTGVSVIEADKVTFEWGHVCFWAESTRKRSDGTWDYSDKLVRAIHNPAVEEIIEVES